MDTDVLRIHLWNYLDNCSLCGQLGKITKSIPYYEEPVATFEESQGGGKAVCEDCYSKWLDKFPEENDNVSSG